MMPVTTEKLTWRDLVRLEPRLGELEREARAVRRSPRARDPHFCANDSWYGRRGWIGFKPRLLWLVGWEARNPALRTCQAYDIAYRYLYDLLPPCRECACL
jgi:hypothetical protein